MEKDDALKPAAVEATAAEPETLTGTHQQTWAQAQRASIKSKARGASEYAMLRTRQGISMFGKPKLGPLVKPKGASAKDESSQSQ
ncbi:unnamed protein product [Miscanthus lutarioriparius]|uniref:Uncharacterized protein n=1 Tax=Miscanthus lutarioriparius TaxID=422564 RepID=A0A811MAP2_9POAL|nr:unnamed protein product [Miscanthus lutarioriparius]